MYRLVLTLLLVLAWPALGLAAPKAAGGGGGGGLPLGGGELTGEVTVDQDGLEF